METQQLRVRLGETIYCALEIIRQRKQVPQHSYKLMPAHNVAFICKISRRILQTHAEHSSLAPDLPLKGVGVRGDWGDECTTSVRRHLQCKRFSTHKPTSPPPSPAFAPPNRTLRFWCKTLTSNC